MARRFTQAHLMLDPGRMPASCSSKRKGWDSFLKRNRSTLKKQWMGEHCACDTGLCFCSFLPLPKDACLKVNQKQPPNARLSGGRQSSVPALQHRELQEVSAACPHLLQFN